MNASKYFKYKWIYELCYENLFHVGVDVKIKYLCDITFTWTIYKLCKMKAWNDY